jgi:hypothetical protein
MTRPSIGDTVRYYDYTYCDFRTGMVTAIDVPVLYLAGACGEFPSGVQIGGSLRRAYDRSPLHDGFEAVEAALNHA